MRYHCLPNLGNFTDDPITKGATGVESYVGSFWASRPGSSERVLRLLSGSIITVVTSTLPSANCQLPLSDLPAAWRADCAHPSIGVVAVQKNVVDKTIVLILTCADAKPDFIGHRATEHSTNPRAP